jgi:small subunit ribosomal protein S1
MKDAATSSPPSAPAEADRDDDTPSPEFATALADFEVGREHAAAAAGAATEVTPGAKVRCTVVSVGDDHVLVDFGGRSEGAVETRHLRNEDGTIRVQPGDALELFVVAAGDQVMLAPSMRLEAKDTLKHIREAQAAGVPVTGRVTAVNSGGLAVDLSGVRGFCPMSQIELGFCSEPAKYVGRTLEFTITKVEEARHSAVVSRRQLLKRAEDDAAKQLIATLKPGDERDGTVARLEAFGAFVDLGGVDGMVHVSEIRHERIGHPNQALVEGQQVRVRVLRIDSGKDGRPRIALSIKAVTPDPWTSVESQFSVGQRVQGTVARLTDFGAFVNLAPGIDGLVHVSEISYERVQHPKDVLKPGQEVEAIVKEVDVAKKRVSLSIKRTLEAPERPAELERPRGGPGPSTGDRPRGGQRPRDRQGPRGSRESRASHEPPKPAAPEEPTTMAIALRKALEEARKRQQGEG